jgi:hypothetical protein
MPATIPKSTIAEAEKMKLGGYAHTMPLHDTEELHHDLGGRANENLALSTALSIDDVFLQTMSFR